MNLSASRVKTYQTCSWQYYLTYILGFRDFDKGNDGSKRGTICHLVLECIQDKISRHYLIEDFQETGFEGHPNIYRLVMKHAKVVGVDDKDNMDLMEGFIKVGLKSDFLCEGWDLQDPEKKFHIENKTPKYKILGFIDKHALDPEMKKGRIDDYKTSKLKFTGKDIKFNIQSLMYSLALAKEYDFEEYIVNFVFLKFPRKPMQTFVYTKEQLAGFEYYLANMYNYLNNFNIKKACSNFARNNDSYFLCGKHDYKLGQLKKDGVTPAWVCPVRQPFLYYELTDEKGKVIKKSKDREELVPVGKQKVVDKFYSGCPAWNKYS